MIGALIHEAATARTDDFEAALVTQTPRLLGIAHAILRDAGEAEDAVQETWELAWRSWDRLRDPERRGAWLRTICVRRCVRRQRGLRIRRHAEAHADVDTAGSLCGGYGRVEWELALVRLSVRQRAVLVLHYQLGYTLDECGVHLGCRPGTVRQHLARALAKLRTSLDG
ncbi:MAG TPA: sigma-70 family RNA polymerase sigma factor [Candidatus Dormibacteraeota bacterium]|jgi:DNA-directed RNA polymerase specialized sigma24 family protein|nr:sigma-70 family RNA polymerase sigma factor [Candidatus Dormibacteraeota bacterium]